MIEPSHGIGFRATGFVDEGIMDEVRSIACLGDGQRRAIWRDGSELEMRGLIDGIVAIQPIGFIAQLDGHAAPANCADADVPIFAGSGAHTSAPWSASADGLAVILRRTIRPLIGSASSMML